MTNDGVNTLTYDGEGRAVTASGSLGSGTYTVDGNGLRVKKVSGSTTTVYIFSGSKVIAEYQNGAAPSAPTTEYVYAGGALLAKINSAGTNYYHQDHLSNRYVTTSSGGKVAEMGHFPYGESWYNATSDKLLFTTYERDAESGNDYAMARYHVSRLGRLSSPDPLSGSISNPQSLNHYGYSINDPANLTDPSGAQTGCQTSQERPTDETQEGAGHGPSTDSDAEAQVQGHCSQSLLPGGSGISLDGADMTDMPTAILGSGNTTLVYPAGYTGPKDGSQVTTINGQEVIRNSYEVDSTTTRDGQTIFDMHFYDYYTPITYWSSFGSTANQASDGLQGPGPSGSSEPSWWGTFAKNFAGNFVSLRFYKEELAPGGCLNTFLKGADEADLVGKIIPPNVPIVESSIQTGAATMAGVYAYNRGLTVPLRSSTVRGMLEAGETAAGAFTAGYAVYQASAGLSKEIPAALSGACH